MSIKKFFCIVVATINCVVYSSESQHTLNYPVWMVALFPVGCVRTAYDFGLGYVYYPIATGLLEKECMKKKIEHNRDVIKSFRWSMDTVCKSFRHERAQDKKDIVTGIPKLPGAIFQKIMKEHFPLQKGSDLISLLVKEDLLFSVRRHGVTRVYLQPCYLEGDFVALDAEKKETLRQNSQQTRERVTQLDETIENNHKMKEVSRSRFVPEAGMLFLAAASVVMEKNK